MQKVGIFYGSTSGNTENIAKKIAAKFDDVDLINIAEADTTDFDKYQNLILGTSTWGIGDLQDDWDDFLPKLESTNLEGKIIALFGLGDSMGYSDSFVDGLGTLYESVKDKPCSVIGKISLDGYSFDDSKAVYENIFIGLPIDDGFDNGKIESSIDNWVEELKKDFK